MQIALTILAILKFLAVELPKFLETWQKYKKDTGYKNFKEKTDKALVEYKKTISLDALKDLENAQ